MSFGGNGTTSISSASDVALSNPLTGNVLTYNATLSKWQNLTAPVTSVNSLTGAVTLTKSTIGLSNVDNTSDVSKPVSTAVQTALNAKADATAVGSKVLLIANTAALPSGTPPGVVVVVQS